MGQVGALSSGTTVGTMSEIDARSLTVADTRAVSYCQGCSQLDRIRRRPGMGRHVQRHRGRDGAYGCRYADRVRAQRLRGSLGCRSDRKLDLGGEPASACGVQDRPGHPSRRREGSHSRCSACDRRRRRGGLGCGLRQVVEGRCLDADRSHARLDLRDDSASGDSRRPRGRLRRSLGDRRLPERGMADRSGDDAPSRERSRSGSSPVAVAVGEGSVWVVNAKDGTVSRIDPANERGRVTDPGRRVPQDVAVGSGRVWVAGL